MLYRHTSLKRLLQDVLVEGEIGDKFLQTGILGLQVFQALELIAVHRAIFALPAVVGVLSYADALDRFGDHLALGSSDFDLAELGDNLIRGVPGLLHGCVRLGWST